MSDVEAMCRRAGGVNNCLRAHETGIRGGRESAIPEATYDDGAPCRSCYMSVVPWLMLTVGSEGRDCGFDVRIAMCAKPR